MARCLELAGHGRGYVAPNPMVGAVIVCGNRIIGEGYHRCYGEAHAEVNAIASVRDDSLLRKSTLYVSLEPCSHYGKTPPCAELIIRKGIPRVVIACTDPYPEVAGRGIKMLREAGVEVVTGIMESEASELNRFFMTAHKKRRPYIILKWAQSADGFIDRIRKDSLEKPFQFSNTITRMMVHKLRSEVQSLIVGTNTAILDNPSLTVRFWKGRQPLRVLIDRKLRVSEKSNHMNLFDGTQKTLVYTTEHNSKFLNKMNIEYVKMNNFGSFFQNILSDLYKRSVQSVLIEGGACIHQCFIEEKLWDEMIIETTNDCLSDGIKSPVINGVVDAQLVDTYSVPKVQVSYVKPSVIRRYINGNI
jgi:riboflavin biosynthesis protein RibD